MRGDVQAVRCSARALAAAERLRIRRGNVSSRIASRRRAGWGWRDNSSGYGSEEAMVAPVGAATGHLDEVVTIATDGNDDTAGVPQLGPWILQINTTANA